jgi:hypothetical protein
MQIENIFSINISFDDVKQNKNKLYLPENIFLRIV